MQMAETDADAEVDQTQAVLRSSALMAVGTITSRITGVARDITIAAALGSFILADTYALGNSLPNIIYILVIGGALNAVFIPQLIRHMKHDADGGDGYADRLITLVGLILLVTSIATVLLAPWIVKFYATSEFSSEELSLATAFARFCLPQIFFYGIYTMFSQVLNSRLHFGAPMFAPIINNVVMIATAIGFIWVAGTAVSAETITSDQVAWLGIGTTLGVAAQALVLVPVLIRVGYRWRPRFDFRGHGLGKAGSLAGWTIGLVLVNQIGFLVISRLATLSNVIASDTGGTAQGLATYQRAFLVFMLPHSVITISLVTALLPRMSKAAADGRMREVGQDVAEGSRLIGAFIVPCVTFLMAFGPMVGLVLFGFGSNSGDPAIYTGLVVSCFAIGLLPFSLFYVMLRGYYSMEDTRTPFIVTVLYNVLSIPLTIALFLLAPDSLKVVALAVGYALSYWVIAAVTWLLLRRRIGYLEGRRTAGALSRMVLAGILAAAIALALVLAGYAALAGVGLDDSLSRLLDHHIASLVAVIVGGILTVLLYLSFALMLRVSEVRRALGDVRARVRR